MRKHAKDIHLGFETQVRRHQKPKKGVSVAPRKGLMSSKNPFVLDDDDAFLSSAMGAAPFSDEKKKWVPWLPMRSFTLGDKRKSSSVNRP